MGWKNVKEHYGIKHYVQVAEKGICIGSGYVHDLIVIADADKPRDWHDTIDRHCTKIGCNLAIWRSTYVGRGEPFDGIVKAMADNPIKLRELIDAPDTFAMSIAVYTYDRSGNIIEKRCEEVGWPNVTHDGDMMYENKFSTDRDQVVEWARENMAAGVEMMQRNIAETEKTLAEQRGWLSEYETALRKIQAA